MVLTEVAEVVVLALLLYVVINFAIIALFIVFIMKSNVPAMLRNRTQEIQKGIEDVKQTKLT